MRLKGEVVARLAVLAPVVLVGVAVTLAYIAGDPAAKAQKEQVRRMTEGHHGSFRLDGTNEQMLNQRTMVRAIQFYFNSLYIPGQAPIVTSVGLEDNGMFCVETTGPEEEE